jgi:hypothetical protein
MRINGVLAHDVIPYRSGAQSITVRWALDSPFLKQAALRPVFLCTPNVGHKEKGPAGPSLGKPRFTLRDSVAPANRRT